MSKIYFCAEDKSALPPTGLEPAIPGLGGRCLIHWATEAYVMMILNIDVFCGLEPRDICNHPRRMHVLLCNQTYEFFYS